MGIFDSIGNIFSPIKSFAQPVLNTISPAFALLSTQSSDSAVGKSIENISEVPGKIVDSAGNIGTSVVNTVGDIGGKVVVNKSIHLHFYRHWIIFGYNACEINGLRKRFKNKNI